MNSRSLLDYLDYSNDPAEDHIEPRRARIDAPAPIDALEARLQDLEARLRASLPQQSAAVQSPAPAQPDLTLSAQIEAILKRKASLSAAPHPEASRRETIEPVPRRPRLAIDPPPSAPSIVAEPSVDPEFAKFAEAVYLMGQAAKRFIDEPQAAPARATASTAPSTLEIDALSAILRETVSACRSVADDLAVSAAEIRGLATNRDRSSRTSRHGGDDIDHGGHRDDRRSLARSRGNERFRDDDDEILNLRETVFDLQDRLDMLLSARRRALY